MLEGRGGGKEQGDRGPGGGRDMRELERDVATTDEGNAARELIQLQEFRAGAEKFLTWDPQRGRPGASRDHHAATDKSFAVHLEAGSVHEVCTAVKCGDARFLEVLLVFMGHRGGEGALEADQIRPIY